MEYKTITPDRYSDVIHHLRRTFFIDEPLNRAVKLCVHGEGNEELEQHARTTLDDNLSIMATNADGEIAGVILNGIVREGDTEKSQDKLKNCPDENFKKIFKLLYDANQKVNLFAHFGVRKILDSRILSVDSKFRGQGIAKALMQRTDDLAKENDFRIIKGDATGIFSQGILKGLGYTEIAEIIYDEYLDGTGEPVLKVEEPHKSLKLMYKILN